MRNLIVIVVIVALVAGGGYLLFKKLKPADSAGNLVSKTTTQNEEVPGRGTVSIAREITIVASEYKFEPSEIRVKKGETVKLTLKNSGNMPHNWSVEKMMGASIDQVSAGQNGTITITPSQRGTFVTYCSIGQHRKLGMVGKLIVE